MSDRKHLDARAVREAFAGDGTADLRPWAYLHPVDARAYREATRQFGREDAAKEATDE